MTRVNLSMEKKALKKDIAHTIQNCDKDRLLVDLFWMLPLSLSIHVCVVLTYLQRPTIAFFG